MARPDVFESLDRMAGDSGDAARQSFEEAPRPYETPDITADRVSNQNQQKKFYGRLKAEDLTQRGIAHYTTPMGDTREVTDSSGAPLTQADKANKVAYDTTGRAVDYSDPKNLQDPYGQAPKRTDKAGNVYRAPKALPWQPTGEVDQSVAEPYQKEQKRKIDSRTATALSGEESDLHSLASAHQKAAKESAKVTQAALMTEIPDQEFDLNEDPRALRQKVETAYNREYGSRQANEKPFFGGGKLSPAAEVYRRDIDSRKASTLAMLDQHRQIAQ